MKKDLKNTMKKYAIFDIGTNSIKCLIAALDKRKIKTITEVSNISRLGKNLDKTGKISKKAMKRNIAVLSDFLQISKENQVNEIYAVSTMVLRRAENSEKFMERVNDELNLEIKIISGEKEAELSYLAALNSLDIKENEFIIFDVGRGSTEFIFVKDNKIIKKISSNIGAVQLTEKFLASNPVKNEELDNMLAYIKKNLKKNNFPENIDKLIGIGGTVTTLGAVNKKLEKYAPDIIHSLHLRLEEVQRQVDLYLIKNIKERRKILGLHPERADIILAGACVVNEIMKKSEIHKLTICEKGIRHGLLYDLLFKKTNL